MSRIRAWSRELNKPFLVFWFVMKRSSSGDHVTKTPGESGWERWEEGKTCDQA